MNDLVKQTWFQCWILSIIALLIYQSIDVRELADLGRYHQNIPDWIMYFQGLPSPPLSVLLFQMGGWLNGLLSLGIYLGLDISIVFCIYAIVCSGIFWYGVRKHPSAVLWLLLIQPIWHVGWRMNWIHALETSLFLLVLSITLSATLSNTLNKKNTPTSNLGLFLLSMLLVWLRPTATIWLSLLVLYIWYQHRRWNHILSVLCIGMFFGALCISADWQLYIEGKVLLSRVDLNWWEMVSRHGYAVPFLAMSLLALVAIKNNVREHWLSVSWIVVSVLLVHLFGVGIDNFPLFFVGIALMAGSTLSKWSKWSIFSWKYFTMSSWLSPISVLILIFPLLPIQHNIGLLLHRDVVVETTFNFIRPVRTFKEGIPIEQLKAVLQTVCTNRKKHCLVVSAGGIAHPHRESLGRLAIFSPNLSHVRLERAGLWFHRPVQLSSVDLAIVQHCQKTVTGDHPVNFLDRQRMFKHLIEQWSLVEVSTSVQEQNCQWKVYKPNRK